MDPIYTQAEAAEILRLKPRTLANWRTQKRGPKFFRIGGLIRYRHSAIQEFLGAAEGAEEASA